MEKGRIPRIEGARRDTMKKVYFDAALASYIKADLIIFTEDHNIGLINLVKRCLSDHYSTPIILGVGLRPDHDVCGSVSVANGMTKINLPRGEQATLI